MKRFIMVLAILIGFSTGIEAKNYIWNTATGSVKEESEVKKTEYLENQAINEAFKDVPEENKVIMPAYFYNDKQLEAKRLLIDTDTFEGVWFVNMDSGEFTEVKGFKKEFLKEELAEGTFDGIEFKMVWNKLYVNINDLKTKGILKDKVEKKPVFKKY